MKKDRLCYHKSEKAELAMLISDKVDFRTRKIIGGKKVLHNDKVVKCLKRDNNPQHICI